MQAFIPTIDCEAVGIFLCVEWGPVCPRLLVCNLGVSAPLEKKTDHIKTAGICSPDERSIATLVFGVDIHSRVQSLANAGSVASLGR